MWIKKWLYEKQYEIMFAGDFLRVFFYALSLQYLPFWIWMILAVPNLIETYFMIQVAAKARKEREEENGDKDGIH